jgi:hypothetical protein
MNGNQSTQQKSEKVNARLKLKMGSTRTASLIMKSTNKVTANSNKPVSNPLMTLEMEGDRTKIEALAPKT